MEMDEVSTDPPPPEDKAPQGEDGVRLDKAMGNLLFSQELETDFCDAWTSVEVGVYTTALKKGWWEKPRDLPHLIALVHRELSEALEAASLGNPPDKNCPEFQSLEIEFADVIIRIMDIAADAGLDIPGAIIAKAKYNLTRPHRHGGKIY